MKYKKYGMQTAIGLALAFAVMWERGLADSGSIEDRVLAVCDGFSTTALLYLSIGILLWVSTTDFFDIFSYALQKGAHAILPMVFQEDLGKYYDYKIRKKEKREKSSGKSSEKDSGNASEKSTLFVGLFFLLISILLTAVWYMLTES